MQSTSRRHRLSTAEIESALILHRGVAETAVISAPDEAVYAFVALKPYVSLGHFTRRRAHQPPFPSEFTYNLNNEGPLAKELILQVRKVCGPFAAPKKIIIVPDLSKTRSRHIMCKTSSGEGDELGDLSTLANPSVVDAIKAKVTTSS